MTDSVLVIQNVSDLDLVQTLDCGQSFRWTQIADHSFAGVAFGRAVTVTLDGTNLRIENAPESDRALWEDYFDLSLDYGGRILRQEPYEALCTFIISQNNNIKRIKGIVQRLCESFGEPLAGGYFTFPTAETMSLLSVEDLAPLRAGFRARYLIDAAQKVSAGEIDWELCRTGDYEQARRELMKITGVGVKVADCTLLFGLHRVEAFPLDVWMKRAMERLFPDMTPADFGSYAGIAQQYIFHFSRMHPEMFV